MNMDCIFKSLLILTFFIVYSNCRTLDEFQFQCYGERTLCSFPSEYCSSEIRKCVECTPAVCSNKENIPLGCSHACRGEAVEVEEKNDIWMILFIVLLVILAIAAVFLIVALKFKIISFRCFGQQTTENGRPKYSSVSSSDSGGSSPSSTLEPKIVQPSSAHGDDKQTKCSAERMLKDVPPAQNPSGVYKPTINSSFPSFAGQKSIKLNGC